MHTSSLDTRRRSCDLVPPRSNASVLHVDAEHYVDDLIGVNNAGVLWLGEPWAPGEFGVTEVTQGFAYAGRRALHAATTTVRQRAMIRLAARGEAPAAATQVIEFMFRPVRSRPVRLADWIVYRGHARDQTTPAAIGLIAHGGMRSGRYRIDVQEGGGRRPRVRTGVLTDLPQRRWTRFILLRCPQAATVQLWAGPPDRERFVGSFVDLGRNVDALTARLGDDSSKGIVGSGYWDDFRIGGLRSRSADLRAGEPAPILRFRQPPPVEPIPVGKARHLLVDKWLIHRMRGVRRRLHAVTKHPANPLVVPEHPWEGGGVLGGGAVFRDEDTGGFRMYYKGWCPVFGPPPKQQRLLKRSVTAIALSDDGIRWVKPKLNVHLFEGRRRNNIVIAPSDRDDREHELWEPADVAIGARAANSISYHPDEPDPEQRYRALVRVQGFSLLTSPDGIHWSNRGSIISQAYDSTTTAFDPVRGIHYASTKLAYGGKRARGYAECADGARWSDTKYQFTVDHRDHSDDQIYGMDAFFYETVHMCMLRMYHVDGGDRLDIQLATARDPRRWDRTFREPFILCGERTRNEWDWGNQSMISVPPVRVGDELWFYYSGRNVDHHFRDPGGRQVNMMQDKWGRIGLGTLRVDGFVSAGAGRRGGVLETKTLVLQHRRLRLNADARGGELRVALTDPEGKPLPGFSAQDCLPLTRDGVRQQVRFRNRKALPGTNVPVRVAFHLRDARLYAFWTE